jgi:anti-anti-sigma factor
MSVCDGCQPEWLAPILFDARVHLSGETVVVDVRGELCLASASRLLERLEELDRGFARLLLDLRRVTFIDCTGIGLLVQIQSRMRYDGLDFAVSVGGAPARTLKLVGLHDHLDRIAGSEIERLLTENSGAQHGTKTDPDGQPNAHSNSCC